MQAKAATHVVDDQQDAMMLRQLINRGDEFGGRQGRVREGGMVEWGQHDRG